MKKLITACILVIYISSCDQEEEIRAEWPFTFIVVNDGSRNLTTINVHASIYYPLEDSTYLFGTIKSIYKTNSDAALRAFDSVEIGSKKNVYQGCVTSIGIRANSVKNENEISFYFNMVDTINTVEQDSLVIVWPKDSALFKR